MPATLNQAHCSVGGGIIAALVVPPLLSVPPIRSSCFLFLLLSVPPLLFIPLLSFSSPLSVPPLPPVLFVPPQFFLHRSEGGEAVCQVKGSH